MSVGLLIGSDALRLAAAGIVHSRAASQPGLFPNCIPTPDKLPISMGSAYGSADLVGVSPGKFYPSLGRDDAIAVRQMPPGSLSTYAHV